MQGTIEKIANWIATNGDAKQRPTLFYDLDVVRNQMRTLSSIGQRHQVQFLLAVKSFPHSTALSLAREFLAGFDVSNANEMATVPECSGKTIVLTGPHLQFPIQAPKGTRHIVFLESRDQFRSFANCGGTHEFGFRLNISQMHPSSGGSRFGFHWDDAIALLSEMPVELRTRFVGFHCHKTARGVNASHYIRAAKWIHENALAAEVNYRVLDLGGGLSDLAMDEIEGMFQEIRSFLPTSVELFCEPGRILSMSAGYALATISSVHSNSDGVSAVLNLSKECHLRWSEPKLVHRALPNANTRGITFYGPTCFDNDVIGTFEMDPNKLRVGLQLVFANLSGYCLAWNTSFNGCPPAEIVFL